MSQEHTHEQSGLTGRIEADPNTLLYEEVLQPQFLYESQNLLRYYLLIEKSLLVEYERMKLLKREEVVTIGQALDQITPETLQANRAGNMSDIAFAIEQHVEQQLDRSITNWHVDRSRNDLQACAQLMYYREQLLDIMQEFYAFAQVVQQRASKETETVMPGYTHYQAAQVMSPGFYFAALSEQTIATLSKLIILYDDSSQCPLGAGAMTGQQLPWDREHMAALLGFRTPRYHALSAVASREAILHIASELSIFCVTLSRFITDLQQWGSSEYRFIDLPDSLSGISSAMPQKKNFPILERIRGKTGHILSFTIDFLTIQRNTPYTNLVETSKEGGSYARSLFTTMRSILRLTTAVIENLQFQPTRMRAVCEQEYLGAFTLANVLTLHNAIPYRTAQIIVGHYTVQMMKQHPQIVYLDFELLQRCCEQHGYNLDNLQGADLLQKSFDPDFNLYNKRTVGSTHPAMVRQTLQAQDADLSGMRETINRYLDMLTQSFLQLDAAVLAGNKSRPE